MSSRITCMHTRYSGADQRRAAGRQEKGHPGIKGAKSKVASRRIIPRRTISPVKFNALTPKARARTAPQQRRPPRRAVRHRRSAAVGSSCRVAVPARSRVALPGPCIGVTIGRALLASDVPRLHARCGSRLELTAVAALQRRGNRNWNSKVPSCLSSTPCIPRWA